MKQALDRCQFINDAAECLNAQKESDEQAELEEAERKAAESMGDSHQSEPNLPVCNVN